MKGQVEREIFKFNERTEIRLSRELSKGRSRVNCTAKDLDGNWRWFGHQFYIKLIRKIFRSNLLKSFLITSFKMFT